MTPDHRSIKRLMTGHLTVTVCMATFNGSKYLREQVDSILSQFQTGDELVVSDDGSTDNTCQILRGYGARIRLVGEKQVGGVVSNFSRALSHARGDLIFLSDQDDVWMPGRLAAMRLALARCELVLTNALVVDEQLRPTGATLFEQVRPNSSFWSNLLGRNSFVGCCIGFRRSLLLRAMPFPTITPWHDWLLGLLACLHGQVRLIDTPFLLFRRHQQNASSTGKASTFSVSQKIKLRCRIIYALLICLLRSSRNHG